MRAIPTLSRAVLLVAALLPVAVLLPSSRFAQASDGDGFAAGVARVKPLPDDRLQDLARRLCRKPDALQAFFTIGSTGRVSGADGQARRLTEEQIRLLSFAAASFEHQAVLSYVRDVLDEETSDAWRRTALRLLAEHAAPGDFSLVAELVVLDRSTQAVRTTLLGNFQETVTAIGRRDAPDLRELNWLANEAEPLRAPVIRAVGEMGQPTGLRWLVAYLGDPEYEAIALQEIGRLAPSATPELAAEISREVRRLLRSPEASTRKQAIRSLSALGDPASVPFLVLALEADATGGVGKMAHSALRQISDIDLPRRPEAWRNWYEAEQRWLQGQGSAAIERLQAEEDALVVSAVQRLSEHSLYRDHTADALAPLLSSHPSPVVRGQVCLALARLGSQQPVLALVDALEDDDETVRRQAHTALGSIAKLQLPADREAWLEVVDERALR